MKKKICSIITMVLCALTFVCLLVPWLKLDLSAISVPLPKIFSDVKLWESGTKYSLIDIFQKLGKYRGDIGKFFWFFAGCIIVQYIFPVAICALSWLKGKAKYIVNLVFAGASILAVLGVHKVLIPRSIEKVLDKMINGGIVGDVASFFKLSFFTETVPEQIGKAYSKSLSIGFWLLIAIMGLIMIVSIVGIVLEVLDKDENTGSRVPATGAELIGMNGIFKDASIPVNASEELIIGRDPSQCHLIIESEQVSRKHCSVSFDKITGQYRITDFSSNGTFINNERRAMKNQPQFVPRGSVISIGDSSNSFRLN